MIIVLILLAISNLLLVSFWVVPLLKKRFRSKKQPKVQEVTNGPDYFLALFELSKSFKQRLGSIGYPMTQAEQGQLAKELLSFSQVTLAVLTERYNTANLLSEQEQLLRGLLNDETPQGKFVFSRDPSKVPTSVIAIADFLEANGASGSFVFQQYQIDLKTNKGLDYEDRPFL